MIFTVGIAMATRIKTGIAVQITSSLLLPCVWSGRESSDPRRLNFKIE